MLELPGRYLKTDIVTMFQMFKKLYRDIQGTNRIQIKNLERKAAMCKMKINWVGLMVLVHWRKE